MGVVLKVLVLPVISLVGVVILKEVNDWDILVLYVTVSVLSLAVVDPYVLKGFGCAVVQVVFVVLVRDFLDSLCNEFG